MVAHTTMTSTPDHCPIPLENGMETGVTAPSQSLLRNIPMVPAISDVGMK